MKLKVEQVGNKDFPRYSIVCENGTWWNDCTKVWTHNQTEATLYASLPVVKETWKQLQDKMEDGKGVVELQATIKVSITSDKPLTADEIKRIAWYLSGASGFTLDYTIPKPEGFENANISTQLVWGDLKEAKAKKGK